MIKSKKFPLTFHRHQYWTIITMLRFRCIIILVLLLSTYRISTCFQQSPNSHSEQMNPEQLTFPQSKMIPENKLESLSASSLLGVDHQKVPRRLIRNTPTTSSSSLSKLWNVFHWFRPSDRMSVAFLPISTGGDSSIEFLGRPSSSSGRRRRFQFTANHFIPVRGKKSHYDSSAYDYDNKDDNKREETEEEKQKNLAIEKKKSILVLVMTHQPTQKHWPTDNTLYDN